MDSKALYQDVILRHYRNSAHFQKELPDPIVQASVNNALCGDEIALSAFCREDRIMSLSFSGEGCALSRATASMVCELLEGCTFREADSLYAEFQLLMSENSETADLARLGDLAALSEVRGYAGRMKCVFLIWEAYRKIRTSLSE